MAVAPGRRSISPMYGNHMGDWWGVMTLSPVLLIVILGLVVYIAARLGIRDGKRD